MCSLAMDFFDGQCEVYHGAFSQAKQDILDCRFEWLSESKVKVCPENVSGQV